MWVNGTRVITQRFDANQVNGFTYDAAGNLTNDGSTSYTYDALNRLLQQDSTVHRYNGDGVLIATDGMTYTQDLAAPLSQVLQTTQGSTTTSYLYGLDRLAAVTGSTRTWYGTDALGSVRLTISAGGLPLSVVNYDPWGTVEGGSVPTFGFTGEVQDAGLVNLRARWYATGQGRFVSRDTFQGFNTLPYSLHSYQYGYSDPVLNRDPDGHCPKPSPAMGDHVICLALFIAPNEVQVKNTNMYLHGDNRGFDSNSNPAQSRGYIWINTDTGQSVSYMNQTGYIFTLPGIDINIPINSDNPGNPFGSPSIVPAEVRSGLSWFGPSGYNPWHVIKDRGTIVVSYDRVLAGPLEQIAPHRNGSITFYQDTDCQYAAYGMRDGFPWAEAYYHDGTGTVQTIFQRRAVRGDPEDLNAIEGTYPYWISGQALYEIRKGAFSDPNPRKDIFGYTAASHGPH